MPWVPGFGAGNRHVNWHFCFLTAFNFQFSEWFQCPTLMIICHPESHKQSISCIWEFITRWALAQRCYSEVDDGTNTRKRIVPSFQNSAQTSLQFYTFIYVSFYISTLFYTSTFQPLPFYISFMGVDQEKWCNWWRSVHSFQFRKRKMYQIWLHCSIRFSLAAGREEDRPLVPVSVTNKSGQEFIYQGKQVSFSMIFTILWS